MQHFSVVMNAIKSETDQRHHPVTLMTIGTKVYLNEVTALFRLFIYLQLKCVFKTILSHVIAVKAYKLSVCVF
jgi:hypothetical protein